MLRADLIIFYKKIKFPDFFPDFFPNLINTAQKGVVLCTSRPRVMPQYEPHLSEFGCRWCRRHLASCSADNIVTDVKSAQIWAFSGWASATDMRVQMTQIMLINKLITRGQHWMCASHGRQKKASDDVLNYLCVGFQAHVIYIVGLFRNMYIPIP